MIWISLAMVWHSPSSLAELYLFSNFRGINSPPHVQEFSALSSELQDICFERPLLWDVVIFFISFNEMSIISKHNLQSTNEGSRYLTFCTMNKVRTHQHEAHQILEDFMRVGLYWTTQYPNALASYFNAFRLSRFLNISASCYSRLFFYHSLSRF